MLFTEKTLLFQGTIYSASLNSIVLHDYCVKDLQFGCLLQGSIFIFLSELSAGQVSLMVYLPGCNLGCPDKCAEL